MTVESSGRHLGLFGATSIGVGAIVGGGVLALAGVAFATTGPSAILAFALNGVIAFVTAASFAELSARFPESGGTYTYAKKVLTIEVAFVVGWVVWFASIVAAVLYALGFAAFAAEGVMRLGEALGDPQSWLDRRSARLGLAILALAAYTFGLVRRAGGGGNVATVGKVLVFLVLIVGGAWSLFARSPLEALDRLDPFVFAGAPGLVQAMGYTFIALQGFDLIAAVGGEVKDPSRTLPRAIYLSLGIALAIYMPLLFLLATVGAPEAGITAAARENPEGVFAEAVERFLGPAGYWLVIVAGVLSMLSALQANLLGASRVAFAMARDRNLPRRLGRVRRASGTPATAALLTAGVVAAVALFVSDVSAAGAASSLIFLISFATVHWAAVLARRRSGDRSFPLLPLVGVTLCLALAVFQGFAVREAGAVVTVWLALGIALYLTLLAPGARLADATAEARDPDLARLRGRSPLVLVPIANPDSAASLVDVAGTVRSPGVGRVLLLSVVKPQRVADEEEDPEALVDSTRILGESLRRSLERELVAETLFTIAEDPWHEIVRVAKSHGCETVLVGLSRLRKPGVEAQLERLIANLDVDVVIVRAPRRFRIDYAKRILCPLGGRRDQSLLRARLLASLSRIGDRHLTFLRVLPTTVTAEERRKAVRDMRSLARDEASTAYEVVVEESDDPSEVIARHADDADLVVLGVQGRARRRSLSSVPLASARRTRTPLILISRR